MSIPTLGLNRLSPMNIEDPLVRVELYREIRDAQTSHPNGWIEYEIQEADALMPELIAYKVYKIDTLKWLVMIAAHLDDPRQRLEVGKTIYLPTPAWIRDRIRHYMDVESIKW